MEKMRYCRALYHVAAAMNSSLSPTSVLEAIVRKTAEAMEVKACSIMLLSPDRRELRHSAHYGLSDWYVRKGPIWMSRDMALALEGRSVTVSDAATDPRVQYRAETIEEGIVSMLSVPIRLAGDVIGVMRVYTAEPREFSSDDAEFLEAVASLGAIALENARRYTEVKVDFDSLHAYIYRYGGV